MRTHWSPLQIILTRLRLDVKVSFDFRMLKTDQVLKGIKTWIDIFVDPASDKCVGSVVKFKVVFVSLSSTIPNAASL